MQGPTVNDVCSASIAQQERCLQVVQKLSGDVPVFISAGKGPDDWEAPAEELDDRFLGDAQIW